MSDERLVYELEREIRCRTDPASHVVVSAYTLRVLFDRLSLAEGRSPGVALDPTTECDGSGVVWRQEVRDDGAPAGSGSEWPCFGCGRCQKGAAMTQVIVKADGDALGLGPVRIDASIAANDFVDRIVARNLAYDAASGDIVLNSSAVYALAHVLATLPDSSLDDLVRQAQAASDAERQMIEPKRWRPPT